MPDLNRFIKFILFVSVRFLFITASNRCKLS